VETVRGAATSRFENQGAGHCVPLREIAAPSIGGRVVVIAEKKRTRGVSVPDREQMTNEDEAVLVGLILLKKQMSVARVAIHPRVQLPVARVQRMADALRAIGMLR
jgi:hypothetical protein